MKSTHTQSNLVSAQDYRHYLKTGSFPGGGILPVVVKGNKYGNKVVKRDGIRYDSKKEHERGGALSILQDKNKISDLRRQVKFQIIVCGMYIGDYIADYVYVLDGKVIVEDVKSAITRKIPLYRWKKKLMKAVHGIDIIEF